MASALLWNQLKTWFAPETVCQSAICHGMQNSSKFGQGPRRYNIAVLMTVFAIRGWRSFVTVGKPAATKFVLCVAVSAKSTFVTRMNPRLITNRSDRKTGIAAACRNCRIFPMTRSEMTTMEMEVMIMMTTWWQQWSRCFVEYGSLRTIVCAQQDFIK